MSNQLLNRHTKVFYQNLNYRGMGVTIFMHPTLWCLLFNCLLTCWTLRLCTVEVSQPEFANNFGIPPIIQVLFFNALLLIESQQECHTSVFYCVLIQNKDLYVVRSDIQLNLAIRIEPVRCPVVRLELTDFPITEHGRGCHIYTCTFPTKHVLNCPTHLLVYSYYYFILQRLFITVSFFIATIKACFEPSPTTSVFHR